MKISAIVVGAFSPWIFFGSVLNFCTCDCLVFEQKPFPKLVSASRHDGTIPDDDTREHQAGAIDRRSALVAFFVAPLIVAPGKSFSADTTIEPNLDCLLDLPAIPEDHVRIFLCRHGQTENNRLRKVQGARVDPPINDNGIMQATNLGKALSRVEPCPKTFFCSNLLRARMTAEIAASQIDPMIQPNQLSSLAEVDFGPVAEGQSIATAKLGMDAIAAAWASGLIDYRPSEGGDSGRDVLVRAVESLRALTNEAKKANGPVVAVAHSTFLRLLIALVLNEPLMEAGSRKIVNGSVSVLDIPKDFTLQKIGPKSTLFGGNLSLAPKDFSLDVPICKVVRINESRYLPTI